MSTSKLSPTILAIETATSACSVALSHQGAIIDLHEVGNNIHSGVLLGMVHQLLSEAGLTVSELDAVAVGQGPGSFTGLRIGVGVAQGLAYGAGCKMIGISSLAVLAQSLASAADFSTGSTSSTSILAGIDARMGEVYWAEFSMQSQSVKLESELVVGAPSQIACSQPRFHLVGNAWSEYWDEVSEGIRKNGIVEASQIYPSAVALLTLANEKFVANELTEVTSFKPIYVRNDVAKKSTKSLPGKRV